MQSETDRAVAARQRRTNSGGGVGSGGLLGREGMRGESLGCCGQGESEVVND